MGKYRSAFTNAELFKAALVPVTAGESIWLGSYQVPVGEEVKLGWGASSGQGEAEGRIYIDLKDDQVVPADVDGTLRLSLYTPLNKLIEYVDEFRTETLRTGTGDRTKQVPYAERRYRVTPFKKIVLEFTPDASVNVSKANSTIVFDVGRIQS